MRVSKPRRPTGADADSPQATTAAGAVDKLDRLVGELNSLKAVASFELACAMGRLIVDSLYSGSLIPWRSHAKKESSFRQLAQRSGRDLTVSASTLYRCVALCELVDRLGVSALKHLSVTAIASVFGLPQDRQRHLLAEARSESWTTRQLQAEAARVRRQCRGGRGRPPLPAVVKLVRRLERVLHQNRPAFNDSAEVSQLSETDRELIRERLERARNAIEALLGDLGTTQTRAALHGC